MNKSIIFNYMNRIYISIQWLLNYLSSLTLLRHVKGLQIPEVINAFRILMNDMTYSGSCYSSGSAHTIWFLLTMSTFPEPSLCSASSKIMYGFSVLVKRSDIGLMN